MTTFRWLLGSILLLGTGWLAAPGDPSESNDRLVFTETTQTAGLLEPLAGLMGHGAAWGDFDGDGLVDLYVGGFCDRPDAEYKPASGPITNRLFRNRGDGTFTRVALPAVESRGRTSGAVFADLDNNGTLELYVANNAKTKAKKPELTLHCQLFRNDQGKLVDISRASGACPESLFTARNVGVLDFDQDGLLDLFVVEDRFTPAPRCALLRNQGGLKFVDVTRSAGLPEDLYGLGLACADLNDDGRPDLFVPHSNRLFLSQKDGKYREAPQGVFAWKPLDREDWPCGACFGDLNRDGRLDLVLSIHGQKARNKVFLNEGLKDGIPQFRDVTQEVGLGETVPTKCPHCEIQDFDNDGWPDIYVSAAWLDAKGKVTPLIYRHLGVKDGMPRFVPPQPIKGPMVYYPTGPSADYDNDGRMDLFLVNWFQGNHCRLLHNDSPKRHWLKVAVRGKKMNRMGIGAQVKIYSAGTSARAEGLLGFQELATGYGFAAGQPALCHFGLGDEKAVDVVVRLPGGKTLTRRNVKADQQILVEEE